MRSKASSSFSRQNGLGIVPSAIKSAYTLPGTCAECHVWLSASRIRHAPPRFICSAIDFILRRAILRHYSMGKQGCQSGDWCRKKISLPIVREGIEELVRKEIIKARQLCRGIALNLIAAGTLQVHAHLVGGLPRRLGSSCGQPLRRADRRSWSCAWQRRCTTRRRPAQRGR